MAHRPLPAGALAAAALLVLACVGCGQMDSMSSEFRPSLERFRTEVQPALDAQGCGRGPDEERGIAGCHTPRQGGLQLKHQPGEQEVILNYRDVMPFVDLASPAESLLLRAPLLGPLHNPPPPSADARVAADAGAGAGPADAGVAPEGVHRVDHPDYAGRFTTEGDCCYCKVLLWICEDRDTAECEACRRVVPCDDCRPAISCVPGGSPERPGDNQAAFAEVSEVLQARCGGCHPALAPPALASDDDVRALAGVDGAGSEYLTPCESGGGLLRYVDGNNNDAYHGTALGDDERGRVHLWVEELGAPAPAP